MAQSAVQFAIQKLNDFLTKEACFLQGVDERVRSLRTILEWIHALLKDVDGKCRESERVKLWVAQIREVAYDAEDVIDSYFFNVKQHHGETSAWSTARGIKGIATVYDAGKKIDNIKRRLQEILSNRSEYGIDNIPASGEASSSSKQCKSWREKRAPIIEEASVVGIEDETKTLLRQLIEGDAQLAVISITGMGGLGKTTLAKKVYNNIHVKKTFDFHAWVYVSQQYLLRELLLSIIKCFTMLGQDEMETSSEEDLRKKLSEYLEGKRYLVVIDDIWTREAWDGLFSAFPDSKKGSRVLLTTRNEEIAKHADAQCTPHKIRFLDESESWVLFCKKSVPENPTPAFPPNLEGLGKKIVVKCGGLPLAITVLGDVLSRKEKSVNAWDKVLRSVEWWLNESEDRISGVLALSYHDLPYHLKPCFLYFGAFPKVSEIHVEELFRLWIAEGFVQKRGEEEMEDVPEDYLDELISRSMIQVVRRNINGTVATCRIYDHLRSLSISEAKEERFLEVHGNMAPESPTKAHRLAITCGDISKSISLNGSTLHLRSLLHFSDHFCEELKIHWGAFKLLRVMHLQKVRLSSLPDEIGYLIHLRYLCLKGTNLERLPSTITSLSNLQTLDLKYTNIKMLPDDIWKMEQIRHLLLYTNRKVPFPISNITQIHRLSNLQTLSEVGGGSWIEDGLEKLTNLRDLEIRKDLKTALSHCICKLVHLRSLFLEASPKCSIPSFLSFSNHQHLYKMELIGRLEKMPDVHEFPPNLAELFLEESQLERDHIGTLEMLPNLRKLSLNTGAYTGTEMLCSVGGFPLLEVLCIGLDELQEWRVEEGALPNLRCLEIYGCKRLRMLPDGLRHVSTLQELNFWEIREEFQERVTSEGEDWFKIQHVPSHFFG